MQWVSRAGPSLIWVTFRPSPTSISRSSSGISSPSNSISQTPPCSSGPSVLIRRTIRQPGRSRSNRKAVRCRRVSAGSGSVRAITMKCCAMAAPEMNHFRPVIVQAPPRRSARVRIIPGIGTAAGRRLGHRKGRVDRAGNDRQEPARLLVLARDRGEEAHVAVVRRRAVEDGWPEDRSVRRLVEGRLGNHGKTEPAKTDRHLRRPQAGRLRLLAQPVAEIETDILVLVIASGVVLERQNLGRDEVRDLGRKCFMFGC